MWSAVGISATFTLLRAIELLPEPLGTLVVAAGLTIAMIQDRVTKDRLRHLERRLNAAKAAESEDHDS